MTYRASKVRVISGEPIIGTIATVEFTFSYRYGLEPKPGDLIYGEEMWDGQLLGFRSVFYRSPDGTLYFDATEPVVVKLPKKILSKISTQIQRTTI